MDNMEELELSRLKAQLETLDQKIDKMIFRNSHDLRGLVCTLLSVVYHLQAKKLGAKEAELLQNLKETILLLDDTIHEINDCSLEQDD